MANLNNGVAVNFGWPGMVLTGTGLGAAGAVTAGLFQSVDHSFKADHDYIRDNLGALATDIVYNPSEEASIEYVFMSVTATNHLADAISQSTIPAIGTIIVITLCTQYPPLNQTNWRVEEATMKGTNTTAKVATLKLVRHAGIAGLTT